MFMNTRDQYGLIARLLHWLIFALVIGMLIGGSLLTLLPSGGFKAFFVSIHKSIGVVIFMLMIGRLIWRRTNPKPRPLEPNPALNYIAQLVHIFLYILLFLQPLVGILMSQAFGHPVTVFGSFQLPPLIWHSPMLGAFFFKVHGVIAIMLIGFIAIHTAAALKHHFIDGNETLIRMVKGA